MDNETMMDETDGKRSFQIILLLTCFPGFLEFLSTPWSNRVLFKTDKLNKVFKIMPEKPENVKTG